MISLKHTLRLATCLTVLGVATPAYAGNVFLLQLGLFSSKESADEQFAKIMESHGKVLDGKRYVPKQGRSISGGEPAWRVLVGPFENRKLASRSCSELKIAGEDCFVVETAAINMDEVESGEALKASNGSTTADVAASDTEVTASETTAETSSSNASSDSSWSWFSGNESKDESKTEEPEPATSEKASSSSEPTENSRININTRSVYADNKRKAAPETSGKSILDLFSSDDTETTAVADSKEDEAPVLSPAETSVEEKNETAKDDATEEVKPFINAQKRTGEVEIAEAIPVPLTDEKDVQVTQSAPAESVESSKSNLSFKSLWDSPKEEAKAAEAKEVEAPISPIPMAEKPAELVRTESKIVPLNEYKPMTNATRMLQVSVFENDRLAFQCLNTLQGAIPAAVMLRSRIIKSTGGQAVLRLGPVNDPDLESEICNVAGQCGEAIQCNTVTERESRKSRRGNIVPLKAPKAEGRHGIQNSSDAPMPRNLSPRVEDSPSVNTSGAVWVQLGTSSSESDARSRFETLKKLHPDVLENFAPVINTPENQSFGKRVYRLRIGSFEDRQKAQSICAKLSSRGVGCLVLSK